MLASAHTFFFPRHAEITERLERPMASKPRACVIVVAVSLLLLLSPAAFAQQTIGIAGVVKDISGGVLPGVTVEAASPALIEKVRTATTDGEGRYNVVDL